MALKTKTKRFIFSLLLSLALITPFSQTKALTTVPPNILYEGRLLNSAGTPITTPHTFRFSLWRSSDFVVGDINGAMGTINTLAPNFAGWQEVQTITPNANGTFSIPLGTIIPLPQLDSTVHKYLQVEVKVQGAMNTSYEIMDPTGDLTIDTNDRSMIASNAFSTNADFLDNAEIGTSLGDIATLGAGGIWDINLIPGGTNADTFILDNDDSLAPGGNLILQFGNTLAEQLFFDTANDWFEFTNDLNMGGYEIKDLSLEKLPAAPGSPVQGQIYYNTGDNNTYVWNGVSWDNLTTTSVSWATIPTRVKNQSFDAEYADAVSKPDGTNNRGTLVSDFIDNGGANKYNYYEFTTTRPTLQDIDLIINYKLPLDFVSFTATPIFITYQTSDGNVLNNKLDFDLYDTAGNLTTLAGNTNLSNAAFTTSTITIGGAPTFTAGQNIQIIVKLSSLTGGFARLSNLTLEYNGK